MLLNYLYLCFSLFRGRVGVDGDSVYFFMKIKWVSVIKMFSCWYVIKCLEMVVMFFFRYRYGDGYWIV